MADSSLREARKRAQWWLDNEGDSGTVSGRSMSMARDVLRLVEAVERTIAFLDGRYETTTLEAQQVLANFLVDNFDDA